MTADERIVWHAELGYVPEWTAKTFDKAKINDRVYPDAASDEPGNEARVKWAEKREREEMNLDAPEPGADCKDCCGDCSEGEKEEKRKDELQPAPVILEPAPQVLPSVPVDPDEDVLQKILAACARFSEKLDGLEFLRARNADLERIVAAMTEVNRPEFMN